MFFRLEGVLKRRSYFALSVLFLGSVLLSGCVLRPGTEEPDPESASFESGSALSDSEPESSSEEDLRPKRDAKGAIVLSSANDLRFLREYPEETFRLAADIDLNGAEWTPIPEFSGVFTGVRGGIFHYKIANFTIVPEAADSDVGFFGNLDRGFVQSVDFENVSLALPAGFSGSAGIVAGSAGAPVESVFTRINDVTLRNVSISGTVSGGSCGLIAGSAGSISNCFVTGALTLSLSGQNNRIGTAAGECDALTDVESSADLSLTGTGNTYAGGLAGVVNCGKSLIYGGSMTVSLAGSDSLIGGVAGVLSGDLSAVYSSAKSLSVTLNGTGETRPFTGNGADALVRDGFLRDVSNLDPSRMSEPEREMREKAVRSMEEQVTMPWMPVRDMDYSDNCASGHIQHYQAYEWYFGLPYTHYCGSIERMRRYMNDDGTLASKVPRTGWERYLGNDCADALYWAWATVSPSITYTLTENMILQNGTVRVGEYEETSHVSTADIVSANGDKTMYEAYAELKPGDALLYGPGHVRMAAEFPTVVRWTDGTINPDASYVVCHEQGLLSSLNETHTTCGYRTVYTFRTLFKANYIPVTIPEFASGEPGKIETSVRYEKAAAGSFESVFTETVESNYRINYVRIVVQTAGEDSAEVDAGQAGAAEVINYCYFPCDGEHVSGLSLSNFRTQTGVGTLPAGTYRYTLSIGIGPGEFTISSFEFTK